LKKLLVQVESAAHFEKKLKSSFFESVLLKFEFFYEIKEDNSVLFLNKELMRGSQRRPHFSEMKNKP
jgi:hypothetical protein